jgi:hypothetical protein
LIVGRTPPDPTRPTLTFATPSTHFECTQMIWI